MSSKIAGSSLIGFWLIAVASAVLGGRSQPAATPWQPPTSDSLRAAMHECASSPSKAAAQERFFFFDDTNNALEDDLLQEGEPLLEGADNNGPAADYTTCVLRSLGLWTDALGFNGRRMSKLLWFRHNHREIQLVFDYCNWKTRRVGEPPQRASQWAYASYRCATVGPIGEWWRVYFKELLVGRRDR